MTTPTHAGRAIVDSLVRHGVRRVYSVPGESYLALLDGLYESGIHNVVCRQEGGAAYMAEAHGKLTGTPGVAMVTRGPGAANAFVAVHTAWQDATPLVLFVGLVPIGDRQRESFQEFDPAAWFGTQTKRVLVLDEPDRASEVVAEAFFAATSGRPGPVVVGLPEDVVAAPFAGRLHEPLPVVDGTVSECDLADLVARLQRSERPLLLVGGARWTPDAAATTTRFAERNALPIVQEWHAADRVPTASPSCVGQLAFGGPAYAARMLEEADLLVTVGAVLGDVVTGGYRLRQDPDAATVVVTIDPGLRGRSGAVSRHVLAAPTAFARAVAELDLDRAEVWRPWTEAGRRAYEEELARLARGTGMTTVLREIAARTSDALQTVGAGNHTAWARLLPVDRYPGELATRNGSMGYAVPAAVVAALEHPGRAVVAVAGDGELLMNGQELATAAQEGAAFLVVVMDNGQYGTIRMHQEREYPGRVSGTRLANPDFAALARAYGGHAETVRADAEAAGAVERALEAVAEGVFALVHVVVDPAVLSP
ncbi:thiamine pyrophosphate-dependent enzyme [Pseudonocardia kunmingensis]|uniref:Acetolactate synthase-1/2/3 large subunit n=1 Tax=Pseudonocardia kunmingensis TaxID=630975 RepID=A0A543DQS9_9PSEU|nr:thiamine pyrophosphate-dependent enzyme [Pseudonocardia kunmingensis]TQM11681.1 acetolactate synthase-1/2/3 large subunit [Pseudonocardia kunmingensis]